MLGDKSEQIFTLDGCLHGDGVQHQHHLHQLHHLWHQRACVQLCHDHHLRCLLHLRSYQHYPILCQDLISSSTKVNKMFDVLEKN